MIARTLSLISVILLFISSSFRLERAPNFAYNGDYGGICDRRNVNEGGVRSSNFQSRMSEPFHTNHYVRYSL